ncbi:hypothetical protein IWQ56_003888, partial [Coemansia nantahalensis]
MEYHDAKGTRLAFKGTAKQQSARRAKKAQRKPRPRHGDSAADDGKPQSGWVLASSPDDLVGPVVFCHRDSDGGLHALAVPTADEALALPGTREMQPAFRALHCATLAAAVPSRVEELFVGRRSVPTTASTQQERQLFSFKSCRGAYLSASSAGN